jgi:S-DNA-T family DNA segregation ATPase FtsK/SpoIIIE
MSYGSSRRFWRYCFILSLAGLVVLSWLSLLSFHPDDPPSTTMYAENRAVQNAAGIVGAYVAYFLRYWLGGGAYMGLAFATVAAFVLILGGRISDMPWRTVGLVLVIVATSTGVYLRNPNPAAAGDVISCSAGVLGIGVGQFLITRFASLGGWIIVIISFFIGLMLTADNLMLQLPRLGKKVWEKRGEVADLADALRSGIAKPSGKPAEKEAPAATGKTNSPKASAVEEKPATPAPAIAAREKPVAAPPPEKPKPAPAPVAARPQPKPEPAKPADASAVSRSGDDAKRFALPSSELLAEPSGGYTETQELRASEKRDILQETLNNFNVEAQVVGHMTGPVITMFELQLAPGVKVSEVANLATDIARSLAVPGVRIVSPIPGKDTVGIEVPNLEKEIVRIKELMNLAPEAEQKMQIPLYLGKDAGGNSIVADLSGMPHMLMAGTTGSGKSVCINTIIMSVLMTRTPEEVRLILVDPKMVEMAAYENLPHLLCPIVNDMRKAEEILEWATVKMDERYELLKEANVKNLAQYNRLGKEELYKRFNVQTEQEKAGIPPRLPSYVIIIDELADLIMTSDREVENHIIRIAQKARAVGIHLILATQRPSVNVVTGLIKSNMPCRISFRVASRQESRIVLDQNGAEVLLGQGDMLFLQPSATGLIRAQGTYVDDKEIHSIVSNLRKSGEPVYDSELMQLNSRAPGEGGGEKDELFDQAVEIVLASQRGSVSLLQRRLQIGYSRASRIIDQMADAGLLGEFKNAQARECLMTLDDWHAHKASIDADRSGQSAANGEPTSV